MNATQKAIAFVIWNWHIAYCQQLLRGQVE